MGIHKIVGPIYTYNANYIYVPFYVYVTWDNISPTTWEIFVHIIFYTPSNFYYKVLTNFSHKSIKVVKVNKIILKFK